MSGNVRFRKNEGAQDKALAALAAGCTQKQAAEAASVDERTVRRWLPEPAFHDQLRQFRSAALEEALTVLAGGATEAARRLLALATEPHPSGSVRLSACRTVLQLSHDWTVASEIERRLELLEEALIA